MGFDHFYGFVGGDTSQWQPNLYRNTTAIYPFQGNPSWNLETAMNLLNLKRTIWSGPALGAGKHTIVFDFKSDSPDLGKGGTGVLSVDGKEVDRKSMEHTTPVTFTRADRSTSARTQKPGSRCCSIATMFRSSSPARLTANVQARTSA